jgi:sugar phosphate isomerase/epimerase
MSYLSRRSFLVQSGLAAAAATVNAAFPKRSWAFPLNGPPGLQLWSVKDPLQQDVPGTLSKVRAIGYQEVETAGFAGLTAQQFRKALDTAGLQCHSCHLEMNTPDLAPLFEEAQVIGAHYAVSAILLPEGWRPTDVNKQLFHLTADDFKRIAEYANRIAEKAKHAGLQYTYHNHNFEFVDLGGGQIGYDILLKETNPDLVKFELDCGWMILSGYNPIDYFHKYPNRYRMMHVKEFVKATQPRHPMVKIEMDGTELGRGSIDYRPIFAAAKSAHVERYFVEQEAPFVGITPFQAIKIDFDYLQSV